MSNNYFHQLSFELLAEYRRQNGRPSIKILRSIWPVLAADLAEHIRPIAWKPDGTLLIATDSEHWLALCERRQFATRRLIKYVPEAEHVSYIIRPNALPSAPVEKEELEVLDSEDLDGIEDNELRDTLARIRTRSLTREDEEDSPGDEGLDSNEPPT